MPLMRPCFACGKSTEVEFGKIQRSRPAMDYPHVPEYYDGKRYEEDMRRYNEELAKRKEFLREQTLEAHKYNGPYCGCLD